MSGTSSLPTRLPLTVDQLIRELDQIVKPPIVQTPGCLNQPNHLIFDAGRRSVVDELLRLLERESNGAPDIEVPPPPPPPPLPAKTTEPAPFKETDEDDDTRRRGSRTSLRIPTYASGTGVNPN